MKTKSILYIILTLSLSLFFSITASNVSAGDLDDNIHNFNEQTIDADHQLGEPGMNVTSKIKSTESRAKVKEDGAKRRTMKDGDKKGGASSSSSSSSKNKGDGSGNMNSVNVGPGSNVHGDIIIIDKSKGPKTNIVK